MAAIFVDDGFTMDGRVPAKPGWWPEVRFKFRPALPAAVYQYRNTPKDDGDKVARAAAKLVAGCLVSWDHGPIDADRLAKMHYRLLDQMMDVVTGYGPDEQARDAGN